MFMVAALVAAAAAPAQAVQTVTVGSTLASAPTSNLPGCAAMIECVAFQTSAGVPVAVAPADGVVTSWRIRAGSAGSPVILRVLRPGAAGSYTAAGTGATQTTTGGASADEFAANLAVNKGDVLAVANSSSALLYAAAPSTFVVNAFQAALSNQPALPDGSSGSPNISQSSYELMMNATVVLDEADLAIAKGDSPDPVGLGQELTYLLTVTNGGPRPAKAVAVSDTLPGGVALVSVTPSAGTCTSGATVTCQLGTLASGRSETVAIVVTAEAAGTLTNTATVSSATTEVDANNNSATSTTTVTEIAQQLPAPRVSKLRLRPARFRRGGFLPARVAAKRRPPVGTTISFVLDYTAAVPVRLRFERIRPGGGRVAAGAFTRRAAIGLNRIRFGGRVSAKRTLRPGRYRVTAVARAGALRSAPVRRTFRLLAK
jgi:uncharacterized repeat protein (TIGR01451 family)